MIKIERLIEELKRRLGDRDFEHTVDEIEWTSPVYNHQN